MNRMKTRQLMMGMFGMAAAGLMVMSQGCSSTSNGGTGGTSGSGTGGKTGDAAAEGGGACTTAAALITDFGGGATLPVNAVPYKGADKDLTVPTADPSSGALVININTGVPTTMYPYAYVGLSFNGCVDASAFTGVKFTASGTLSAGCSIQFSTVDKEHSTVGNNGTCTETNCYASSKVFPLPATPTDTTVLFLDQTGGGRVGLSPAEVLVYRNEAISASDICLL